MMLSAKPLADKTFAVNLAKADVSATLASVGYLAFALLCAVFADLYADLFVDRYADLAADVDQDA